MVWSLIKSRNNFAFYLQYVEMENFESIGRRGSKAH
jgi:hypothetical protein